MEIVDGYEKMLVFYPNQNNMDSFSHNENSLV
jgi:hypothetical protein